MKATEGELVVWRSWVPAIRPLSALVLTDRPRCCPLALPAHRPRQGHRHRRVHHRSEVIPFVRSHNTATIAPANARPPSHNSPGHRIHAMTTTGVTTKNVTIKTALTDMCSLRQFCLRDRLRDLRSPQQMGSLAILTAIRRASSLLSRFVTLRRDGSSSNTDSRARSRWRRARQRLRPSPRRATGAANQRGSAIRSLWGMSLGL